MILLYNTFNLLEDCLLFFLCTVAYVILVIYKIAENNLRRNIINV